MYIRHISTNEKESLETLPRFKAAVGENIILESVSTYCKWPPQIADFSLKWTFKGNETYFLQQHKIPVNEHHFLIVNAGQEYTSEIMSRRWVHSVAIFFNDSFLKDAFATLTKGEDKLLMDPYLQNPQKIWFFEQVYETDELLNERILQLLNRLKEGNYSNSETDEYLFDLLDTLLQKYHFKVLKNSDNLSFVKRSTRMEIYRRLQIAKEFINDNVSEQITLQDISSAAMLSKTHLLKNFRQMFHQSPHQYLIDQRLHEVRNHLVTSDMPVNEIAAITGFEDTSSFGRLFKSKFEITPQQFRIQNRK